MHTRATAPCSTQQDIILYIHIQWNLSYPGSVGPRGARNFKIAHKSELIHELCTYSTWLYKNTGHQYIKHKNVYMYGIRNIYESG